MSFEYHGVVCSDLGIIKEFVNDTLNKLSAIIHNNDLMFDIKLILNELVINGALHGNQCVTSKCIKLSLEVKDNKLTIVVEDEGRGFHCDLMSYNPLEMKSSGRGLVIVNGLSDEFYVDNNKVVAVKNIN